MLDSSCRVVDLVTQDLYSNINMGIPLIFVEINRFLKYFLTFKIENKRRETISDCPLEIIEKFSPPLILHSGNDLEFINNHVRALKEEYDFFHVRGRPGVLGCRAR